jgi:DNA-directed RNA polymerase subunit beta
MLMRRRELLVLVAALIGAVIGFYSGGGQGSPQAILENPDLLQG